MVTILCLVGAVVVGLLIGLAYTGALFVESRRKLDLFAAQLQTEHRLDLATRQTIAQMRAVVQAHLQGDDRSV